jgi:hypothetical protein
MTGLDPKRSLASVSGFALHTPEPLHYASSIGDRMIDERPSAAERVDSRALTFEPGAGSGRFGPRASAKLNRATNRHCKRRLTLD